MESIFCQDNHISDIALLDNMVHTATATASKACGDSLVSLSEVREFSLCFLPKIGEKMNVTGKVMNRKGANLLVEARVYVEGEIAARCKVKFHKEDKNENTGDIL